MSKYYVGESDVDFAILAFRPKTPLGFLFYAILVGVMLYFQCADEKECSTHHCERGTPVVSNHRCICIEEAQ